MKVVFKQVVFEPVPHPPQQYSDNCPTEEKKNGETRSLSSLNQTRPLVRAKSSVGMEEERKVLCESLSSSASNSQHSLTGLLSHPAPPRKACPMVPRQPNRRVRAAALFHPCFHPCFFPSRLLSSLFVSAE